MPDKEEDYPITRREFLRRSMRWIAVAALGSLSGVVFIRRAAGNTVWQIDPDKCVQCGNCSTECVLSPSAVKCVHAFEVCGYCDLCSGYLRQDAVVRNTAPENRLCPTGAIQRSFVEDPFFEYVIVEKLCIACGRCVKGCTAFGNGSLFLQVRHDRCLNCNACSIARKCPSGAYERVPIDRPYLYKGGELSS